MKYTVTVPFVEYENIIFTGYILVTGLHKYSVGDVVEFRQMDLSNKVYSGAVAVFECIESTTYLFGMFGKSTLKRI